MSLPPREHSSSAAPMLSSSTVPEEKIVCEPQQAPAPIHPVNHQQEGAETGGARAIDSDSYPEVVLSDLPESAERPIVQHPSTHSQGQDLPPTTHDQAGHNYEQQPNIRVPATEFQAETTSSNPPNSTERSIGQHSTMSKQNQHLPGTAQSQAGQDYVQQPTMRVPATGFQTVTPLHLLGDHPEMVDCPFCRQASLTKVKKHPSFLTHVLAAGLFFGTLCGVLAPYVFHWLNHLAHYCTNCGRKLAYRRYGSKTMQVHGTPEHLKQASKYDSVPM